MKKFKFNKVSIIIAPLVIASFVLSFVGLNSAQAVVTPPDLELGTADGYSVYGHTGITDTNGGTSVTRVWGNVGGNGAGTGSLTAVQVPPPGIIDNTGPTGTAIELDARSVYDSLMSDSGRPSSQTLDLAGPHTTGNGNPITPGVYNVGATTMNGAVELSGAGVYIFRSSSSATIATSGTAHMTLTNGASPCDVWWAIPASMTIGSDSIMVGNIIASTGLISLGTSATLEGRAISLSAAVTLDANQITEPICAAPATLNVIKHVSGGTASAGDWTLTVASSNSGSGTDSAAGSETGTAYTLEPGHQYSVTENTGPSRYTSSSSDNCTIANAVADTTYNCTITNTYHAPSRVIGSIPRVVVPVFQPSITILSTPVVIVPKLPKTGFAPQESGMWYESLLNNILNLFR